MRINPIAQDRCLALLEEAEFGRLAFTADGVPTIRPVNHRLLRQTLIIRTTYDSLLGHLNGDKVAYEVDEIDPATHAGWSVVATGTATPISDVDEIVEAAHPRRRPWAEGDRGQFLKITIEDISGRQLSAF
jgi:nitroimidazol reductase NimA-like FMN-containing flavoprotein (pyridoxamine 5'-phosphate oxidase superfamily)